MTTVTLSTVASSGPSESKLVAIPVGAKFVCCMPGGMSAVADPFKDPQAALMFRKLPTKSVVYHVLGTNILSYGSLGVPIPDGSTIVSWFNGQRGVQQMTFIFRIP